MNIGIFAIFAIVSFTSLSPSHWGQTAFMAIANDVWPSCYHGKMQSPISISTKHLVFDSNLTPLKMSGSDKQLQLYAFNFVLYPNYSVALSKPNGLAVISVFFKIGDQSSADMAALLSTAEQVQLKGQLKRLNGLLLDAILPSILQYMTYQGSLPFPACYETVTWIVLNQPIIITETQLKSLRKLRIAPFHGSGSMADNYRTVQKLNNRSVRTNIDFEKTKPYCSVQSQRSYMATSLLK
uniref:Alpha-carbonic anhydrase domain-containing protein n=1 Tax=Trichobilharzia regenti TaxID=157069 RepID=A0AA85KMM8_TRIRE|nr:unnamed protein product [Trichobilharzia regenti]